MVSHVQVRDDRRYCSFWESFTLSNSVYWLRDLSANAGGKLDLWKVSANILPNILSLGSKSRHHQKKSVYEVLIYVLSHGVIFQSCDTSIGLCGILSRWRSFWVTMRLILKKILISILLAKHFMLVRLQITYPAFSILLEMLKWDIFES